uniref:Uncharacterized protein n=1 Tax=Schistocephalus solidus TaxID=70667 RepID=A0A0V0J764_SCHSO
MVPRLLGNKKTIQCECNVNFPSIVLSIKILNGLSVSSRYRAGYYEPETFALQNVSSIGTVDVTYAYDKGEQTDFILLSAVHFYDFVKSPSVSTLLTTGGFRSTWTQRTLEDAQSLLSDAFSFIKPVYCYH